MERNLLTEEHTRDFITNGYVVIPNVFSAEEIQCVRDNLHERMFQLGFDYNDMTADKFKDMPRFGCQTEIFYPDFKMSIHEDPKFFNIVSGLFEATFAAGIPGFESPYAGFNPRQGYMYMDRLNCRLPDAIKAQGGLGLHVDCNPLSPCDDPAKWRPIQASVMLTDSLTPTSGGLYVVPGMHTCVKEYVQRNNAQTAGKLTNKGNCEKGRGNAARGRAHVKCSSFTRFDKCSDMVDHMMVPVLAPAGSIILWDNRLPHATAEQHDGPDTREVLFMTYLPDIPKNQAYAHAQRKCFFSRTPPPDFHTKSNSKKEQEEPTYAFSQLGRRLMTIEPWPEEKEKGKDVDQMDHSCSIQPVEIGK
jgi:hypothetical protein